jgi:hypothetical protein
MLPLGKNTTVLWDHDAGNVLYLHTVRAKTQEADGDR